MPGGGRRAAARLPGVEPDVVVVAAGGDEGGVGSVALGQLEAEHAAIELERAVDVGDFEVDVADVDAGIDRLLAIEAPPASLTRRSASAFSARRTWRMVQLSKSAAPASPPCAVPSFSRL